jgi:hypothetical protein
MVMEIIATTIGVVGAAVLISHIPKLAALVNGNSIWSLTNNTTGPTSPTSTS